MAMQAIMNLEIVEVCMRAIWKDTVIAESPRDELIYIEGNWYFPPARVNQEYLQESPTPYTCPWKGVCQYYHVVKDGETNPDAAWCYPDPIPRSIDIVKKDYAKYIAFSTSVIVGE